MNDLPTTTTHRLYTLLGATFVVFEGIFLVLWSNDFWFRINLVLLALPTLAVACLIAHLFLCWQESRRSISLLSWLFKGQAPISYRRWLSFDEQGITVGQRRLIWSAIDGLTLTIFGNLQVRSFALTGPSVKEPEVVLKLPFGAASVAHQIELVSTAKKHKQTLLTNQRLEKAVSAKPHKGEVILRNLYAAFVVLLLCDISFSTFSYLEMMKQYHLAQSAAKAHELDKAQMYLRAAEAIQDNPPIFSYTTPKLMKDGAVAAGGLRARAETLYALGDTQGAIEAAEKAQKAQPMSYKSSLLLARLFAREGKIAEARSQVITAIDLRADELIPYLYMMALYCQMDKRPQAERFYRQSMNTLLDEVFGEEPLWPPGGNRNLHELFSSEDVNFLFERLLKPG